MTTLESLTPGTAVRGIRPDAVVTVIAAQWHSITLTFELESSGE